MHVIEHIIMAEKEAQEKKKAATKKKVADPKRLQALEAKAVAEATATADAAFTPSASLLNAPTAAPLLKQVDGLSLKAYEGKESVYVGRSVPVSAGGTLKVPIQVTTPGSVVEYAVENKSHDFAFGITAEREEGVTIVKVSRGDPCGLRLYKMCRSCRQIWALSVANSSFASFVVCLFDLWDFVRFLVISIGCRTSRR